MNEPGLGGRTPIGVQVAAAELIRRPGNRDNGSKMKIAGD